jgi:hypothetical protein
MLLCVGVMAGAAAPRAYGQVDEVEQLFQRDALPREIEPLFPPEPLDHQVAVPREIPRASMPDATNFAERSAWTAHSEPSTAEGAVGANPLDHDRAAQRTPAAPMNPVPEPSAIILALAALVYFLLFGRRRRVI